jgi:hypothetical protein
MSELEMMPVRSETLKAIGYDLDTNTLRISFKSGGVYEYAHVPESRWEGLQNAVSKGSYFHRYIKDKYRTRKVS